MKAVTIYVSDATAKRLVQLAKTGFTRNDDAGWSAYTLLTEHACPVARGANRVIVVGAGGKGAKPYMIPNILRFGRLR